MNQGLELFIKDPFEGRFNVIGTVLTGRCRSCRLADRIIGGADRGFCRGLCNDSGHRVFFDFIAHQGPFAAMPHPGQKDNFQIRSGGYFKGIFALIVGAAFRQFDAGRVVDFDFAVFDPFAAAELALGMDGIALDPGKYGDLVGPCGIGPQEAAEQNRKKDKRFE